MVQGRLARLERELHEEVFLRDPQEKPATTRDYVDRILALRETLERWRRIVDLNLGDQGSEEWEHAQRIRQLLGILERRVGGSIRGLRHFVKTHTKSRDTLKMLLDVVSPQKLVQWGIDPTEVFALAA